MLALLATGKLPKVMVKLQDFSDENLRAIANDLLSGISPAEIIAQAENDAIRQAAGEVFTMLSDDERENAATIAGDCLRNLQIQHLQQDIQNMSDLMKAMTDAESRSQALREVSELSKELARLKQQGR